MTPTRFIHSRASIIIGIILTALCCLAAFLVTGHQGASAAHDFLAGDRGVVFPSANEWIPSLPLRTAAAFALNAAIILLMTTLNRWFNLTRSMTYIFALLFAIFQTGTPLLTGRLYTAPVMTVVIIISVTLMLSCYSRPSASRRVFLIFFILSAAVATQYSYIFYIPVFIFGCAQMRIFSRRTLLAVILGLMTPWWIMLGSGLITPADIHLPVFASIFSNFGLIPALAMLSSVSLTVLITLACYLANFIKALTYNAQTRAKNGLMLIIFAVTVMAMAIDYINLTAYVSTLNFCAAFIVSQIFVHHRTKNSYIPLTCITAAYLILFAWNI